jgi:hypothetical protein
MKDKDRKQLRLWNLAFAAAVALTGAWSASRAEASQLDLTVHNASGRPIITVYVSPASVRSWGEDVLGRGDLPHGESAYIRFAERSPITPCLWDVKFVYRGGTSAVSRVNACNGDAVIAPR